MSNTATITLLERPTLHVGTEAHYRHLSVNASACDRCNVEIRVISINTDRSIAVCTVRQRHRGVLRRTYSRDELLLRAEQALAPLLRLGILPMINMPDPKERATLAPCRPEQGTSSVIARVRSWLGYPDERTGLQVSSVDPFGLFAALRRATNATGNLQPSC